MRESNARKRLSIVPAMNTSPPAVTIGPPCPKAPVFLMPFASSSSLVPSGTLQAMSPVLALTAIRCAHGGGWHGRLFAGSQKRAFTVPRPSGLKRRYATVSPSGVLSRRPMPPTSRELTKT